MARYCASCGHAEDQHDEKVGCTHSTGDVCPCQRFIPVVPIEHRGIPDLKPGEVASLRIIKTEVRFDGRIVAHYESVPERKRTPAPGVLLLPEQPSAAVLITVGGKQRPLAELEAAANAIIAETNAGDLAEGVDRMRRENAKLRRKVFELSQLLRETGAKLLAHAQP